MHTTGDRDELLVFDAMFVSEYQCPYDRCTKFTYTTNQLFSYRCTIDSMGTRGVKRKIGPPDRHETLYFSSVRLPLSVHDVRTIHSLAMKS